MSFNQASGNMGRNVTERNIAQNRRSHLPSVEVHNVVHTTNTISSITLADKLSLDFRFAEGGHVCRPADVYFGELMLLMSDYSRQAVGVSQP